MMATRIGGSSELACALAIVCFALAFSSERSSASFFGLLGQNTNVADTHRTSEPAGEVSFIEAPILEMLKSAGASDPNKHYMRAMLNDQESYDFNARLSTIDILYRSGWDYEIHNCTALDGYVTNMIRIVNPLIERANLRKIPIVLYTGQGTSPAIFLVASLGSHRPVRWQPAANLHEQEQGHGQQNTFYFSESERSLAAVLANNGYDVWIVPTRGVDLENRKRVETRQLRTVGKILKNRVSLMKNVLPAGQVNLTGGVDVGGNLTATKENESIGEKIGELVKSINANNNNYWSFSSDEIIENELEVQLEKILMITSARKLSLITYSNGGFITFGFLASHPGYALKNIDLIVNLAPAVYVNRFNLIYAAWELLSNLNPSNSAYPDDALYGISRAGIVHLCRSKIIRYSLCKVTLDQLYGPSDLFETHLELALFDFVGRPQSAAGLRQTVQSTRAGHLACYDRGLLGNLISYNKLTPREYILSKVNHPRNYVLIGTEDAIVDELSLEKLIAECGVKPHVRKVKGFNHLDLLAGHDNALKVNKPILQLLNDRYLELEYYHEEGGEFASDGGDGDDEGENERIPFDTTHNRLGTAANLNINDNSTQVAAAGDKKNSTSILSNAHHDEESELEAIVRVNDGIMVDDGQQHAISEFDKLDDPEHEHNNNNNQTSSNKRQSAEDGKRMGEKDASLATTSKILQSNHEPGEPLAGHSHELPASDLDAPVDVVQQHQQQQQQEHEQVVPVPHAAGEAQSLEPTHGIGSHADGQNLNLADRRAQLDSEFEQQKLKLGESGT